MSTSVQSSEIPVIAIDGPSGSGKGTVARQIADLTGFTLLDSGALYRLTALAARQKSIEATDEKAVAQIASQLDIEFRVEAGSTRVFLENNDVTKAIRTEEIGLGASVVAALPMVRSALLERQRAFACPPGLVADGRDMGTVVFPQAQVKVFLTASAEERAKRRLAQLQLAGEQVVFEKILRDIEARDLRDTTRTSAPLKPAPDAIIVDSTHLGIEQVVNKVLQLVESHLRDPKGPDHA